MIQHPENKRDVIREHRQKAQLSRIPLVLYFCISGQLLSLQENNKTVPTGRSVVTSKFPADTSAIETAIYIDGAVFWVLIYDL